MTEGTKLFMPNGATWVERAAMGELRAVISPTASDRGNDFHNAVHVFGATVALRNYRTGPRIIDFGCGTGRFVRFFADKGLHVFGTEITFDMLAEAHRLGVPSKSLLLVTNGISLPVADESIDAIWCCGVLRYSRLVSQTVYEQIAQEMYRVLKPNGVVMNLEMYVDSSPDVFTYGFEKAGFVTKDLRVLKRYDGFVEDCLKSSLWPRKFVIAAGKVWGALHYWFDSPHRKTTGLRDYLFFWTKPSVES